MRHIVNKLQDVVRIGEEYIHLIFSSDKHCIGGFECDVEGVISDSIFNDKKE